MPKRSDISSILIIGAESHSRDDRWWSPQFRLEAFDQAVVTGVRADPEPDDDIVLDDADGAVSAAMRTEWTSLAVFSRLNRRLG
ncbi:MAG: hypothetical protein IIA00_07080 [Proteobacteria bacterium]|nr:hypothetical protein [Pseudomonadota bacterium]